jgi:hypothetical protein
MLCAQVSDSRAELRGRCVARAKPIYFVCGAECRPIPKMEILLLRGNGRNQPEFVLRYGSAQTAM